MNIQIATEQILEDVLLFLSKLDNKLYAQPIPALFNGTLGKHTRHLIELYQCLLFRKQIDLVNYDARIRDPKLETNLEAATKAIHQIKNKLSETSLEEQFYLSSLLTPNQKTPTNITRELLFNHDHCVHHLALMKIGLNIIRPNITLPNHLGIAVSTLKYKEANN